MRNALCLSLLIALSACSDKSSVNEEDDKEASSRPQLETSEPSKLTIESIRKIKVPIRALVFAPPGSSVGDQFHGYLTDLARRAAIDVEVVDRDRIAHPADAAIYDVRTDGTLVLATGDRHQQIQIGNDDTRSTRDALLGLDKQVRAALEKLARDREKAALVGPPATTLVTRALETLDIEVERLEPSAIKLPQETTIFLWIDDGRDLSPDLISSVNSFLQSGGSALLAAEPGAGDRLSPFRAPIGISLDPTPLVDEKHHINQSRTEADYENIATTQFALHPSTETVARNGNRSPAVFFRTGSLEASAKSPAKTTTTVRSSPDAFRDKNGNRRRDGGEKASSYALAMAITAGPKGRDMRALAFADASWLDDKVVAAVVASQGLLIDSLKWLRRDDALAEVEPKGKDKLHEAVSLRSYPRRGKEAPPVPEPLWSVKMSELDSVRIASASREITIRRDGDDLIASEKRSREKDGGVVRTFPLSRDGRKLVEEFLAGVPVRVLDQVGAADHDRMTLDGSDKIVVTAGTDTFTLTLGAPTTGGGERYARLAGDGRTYVLDSRTLRLAQGGATKLMVRELLPAKVDDLEYVIVETDADRWKLVRYSGKWRVEDHPTSTWLAETTATLLERIRPLDFAPEIPDEATRLAMFNVKSRDGMTTTLSIYQAESAEGATHWVTSSHFKQAGRITVSVGERLKSAVEQLVQLP